MALAKSNLLNLAMGPTSTTRWVSASICGPGKVGAHFAISSMFDGDHVVPQYCYCIRTLDYRHAESGTARLALGLARVTSQITRESSDLSFAAVYLGDEVLHAGVRETISMKNTHSWWRRA